MNESQDALRESTNGNFKQSCHCLLQLIKIPIKFRGCDSNIFPLIYVLDKDCDWQVTEAGVIRRQIQKPERSSEEVSKPTFYFFKNFLCLLALWPAWSASAVTPHVSPTWECTWLTWPSLRREHPTTLKTTLSTSPRWEWYRTSNFNLVLLCKVFFTCVWSMQ